MPRRRIRERHNSLFEVGLWPLSLFSIAVILAPIARTDYWTDWLATSLRSAGITGINDIESKIVGGSIALGFGIAGAILAHRSKLSRQVDRDSEIQLLGPKALFLRPYFSDKKFLFPNPFYSYWSCGISLEPIYMPPEEFVGRILEPYVSVMEIGGDPKFISGGKIYSPDDCWRESFIQAVERATFVVIMPMLGFDPKTRKALGEATIWELRYLVESENIHRTIVLMPKVPPLRRKYARQSWERARLAAASFGLTLPEYKRNGAIILFRRKLGIWEVAVDFIGTESRRASFAVGLVEAVEGLAAKNGFALHNR